MRNLKPPCHSSVRPPVNWSYLGLRLRKFRSVCFALHKFILFDKITNPKSKNSRRTTTSSHPFVSDSRTPNLIFTHLENTSRLTYSLTDTTPSQNVLATAISERTSLEQQLAALNAASISELTALRASREAAVRQSQELAQQHASLQASLKVSSNVFGFRVLKCVIEEVGRKESRSRRGKVVRANSIILLSGLRFFVFSS